MTEEPRDGQVRLLWTARIDYPRGSGVRPHSHADHYQLLIVTEGEGRIRAGSEDHRLDSGCCCLLRPGVEHTFQFDKAAISFDYKFVVADAAVARFADGLPAVSACTPESLNGLRHIFRLSLAQKRQPQPLRALRIDALFKSVLLGLAPEPSARRAAPDDPLRFPMAAYLQERLDRQMTLEELAGRFNFHPHYIVELFRRHTGETPIRYHQLLRLAKVKELLEFTGLPVSEIAQRVGWSAPYLSRLFFRHEGMTASDYRRELVQAIDQDIVLDPNFTNKRVIFPGSG